MSSKHPSPANQNTCIKGVSVRISSWFELYHQTVVFFTGGHLITCGELAAWAGGGVAGMPHSESCDQNDGEFIRPERRPQKTSDALTRLIAATGDAGVPQLSL